MRAVKEIGRVIRAAVPLGVLGVILAGGLFESDYDLAADHEVRAAGAGSALAAGIAGVLVILAIAVVAALLVLLRPAQGRHRAGQED